MLKADKVEIYIEKDEKYKKMFDLIKCYGNRQNIKSITETEIVFTKPILMNGHNVEIDGFVWSESLNHWLAFIIDRDS